MKTFFPRIQTCLSALLFALMFTEESTQGARQESSSSIDPAQNRRAIRFAPRLRSAETNHDARPSSDNRFNISATESAVTKALDWLTQEQSEEGYWKSTHSKVAHTGLVVLCYLSYGVLPEDDTNHGKALDNGLKWLIQQSGPDGDFRDGGKMYGQAIAALTLAEAFKLTENEVFKSKLTPAVRFLERAQNPTSGGWRHVPYPDSNDTGDLSVTGWVIMGLESAKNAGVDVSNDCLKKANEYLDSVASGKENGLYGYKSKLPQKSMTAVGMFCRQLGEYKTNNQQKVSAEFLSTHFPRQDQRLRKSGHYHYWFYGTLALFSYGGDEWKNWHDRLIPILLNKQEQDGSWSPQGPRQRHEGRVVTTAWATLCMTVYYRCLPVIQKSTPGVRPEAGQDPQTEGRPGAQIQSEYSSRYRALRPQTR